ncbi:MAG: pyrroline-5-carboxylate reductase [Woeseiaceae bacterium]|nr:pyrroline-5-carboxylate reductase [Woeseiaceae bacterium]
MSNTYLGFIGGGNMATAIIRGLLDDGMEAERILVSEPGAEQQERLRADFPDCHVTESNQLVASRSNTLVLAVKPQVLAEVCTQIATEVGATRPLIISIAAGVRTLDIDDWLGGGHSIVRVMPNQPALLRQGISGLYANDATTDVRKTIATDIIAAIGDVVEVDRESDIDVVTAVSGSGPAYVYLLIKMLTDSGISMGLDAPRARQLAVKTATGSAMLADQSDDSMDELIARVRSPGGTTAAALDSLDNDDVHAIFRRALRAARDRAVELADKAQDERAKS